jgi:hypothetical protein
MAATSAESKYLVLQTRDNCRKQSQRPHSNFLVSATSVLVLTYVTTLCRHTDRFLPLHISKRLELGRDKLGIEKKKVDLLHCSFINLFPRH